ncbi:hypothetical protein [Labrenzia sp. PHM005]|uniref:hypothetical protein n=1 Tax=Labrenzia sp. PHM005 TaxID=2590016 RepID=UPI0011407FC0|nr:hypothetical protein [Labrenzia sp. PHM005]QDG79167.1 hypothetical protein FJ695_26690 [Labrenzia sp. PHM005]
MTDSAETTLELIIQRIEGDYSDFSISSRWGRRQLMLNRKMFATFSKFDMSFKLGEGELGQAYSIAGVETWNPKGRKNPSRSWVLVPISQQKHWMSLALDAANYVNERNT